MELMKKPGRGKESGQFYYHWCRVDRVFTKVNSPKHLIERRTHENKGHPQPVSQAEAILRRVKPEPCSQTREAVQNGWGRRDAARGKKFKELGMLENQAGDIARLGLSLGWPEAKGRSLLGS